MKDRALRRFHKSRMKKKARKVYPWCSCPEKYADHLALCSCPMCGNPRRHRIYGEPERTLQELRAGYGRNIWEEEGLTEQD